MDQTLSIEERVARLEGGSCARATGPLTQRSFLLSLGLSAVALYLAFRGLGFPNHPYQAALGILTVALGYHRRWFRPFSASHQWGLALLNAALVAMLFKLLIGGGVRHPFFWVKYPAFEQWQMIWQDTPLAAMELDLTIIQSFLLLITLAGALFRFQPFVSLTAFLLVIVSIPAFASFDWQWVFPALIVGAVSLYAQSQG